MDGGRLRRLVGPGMVSLGLVKVWLGLVGDDPVYAGLGAVYGLLGVARLRAEAT